MVVLYSVSVFNIHTRQKYDSFHEKELKSIKILEMELQYSSGYDQRKILPSSNFVQ